MQQALEAVLPRRKCATKVEYTFERLCISRWVLSDPPAQLVSTIVVIGLDTMCPGSGAQKGNPCTSQTQPLVVVICDRLIGCEVWDADHRPTLTLCWPNG